MTTTNSGAKEKLVTRLLEGDNSIFEEFVVVGLEYHIDLICKEIDRLLGVKKLEDFQFTDLLELYHNGKAIIRVLRYYTGYKYETEMQLVNKAWDKLRGEIF
jgi:phosphopantetheine adenylyltransferase